VSNNVAEYNSLILGLELAVQQNITSLHIRGDSNLIITHLKGTASSNLQPLYNKARSLVANLTNHSLEHVF
jgi:ribonuclease HI